MRTVRISLKRAQQLLEAINRLDDIDGGLIVGHRLAQDALSSAIGGASKPKRSVKAAKARRTAKKATKREETAAIRVAVMKRAGELCELCGGVGSELHHALGRIRVKQSERNCLWLCFECHRGITLNRPSAAYWMEIQAAAFSDFAPETAASLFRRSEFVSARSALSHREGAP